MSFQLSRELCVQSHHKFFPESDNLRWSFFQNFCFSRKSDRSVKQDSTSFSGVLTVSAVWASTENCSGAMGWGHGSCSNYKRQHLAIEKRLGRSRELVPSGTFDKEDSEILSPLHLRGRYSPYNCHVQEIQRIYQGEFRPKTLKRKSLVLVPLRESF